MVILISPLNAVFKAIFDFQIRNSYKYIIIRYSVYSKFLEDYEMDDYATDVKNNYDGYKFCDKEMFCPWDVVNFIKENYKNNLNGHTELVKANNYWENSSSDSALGEYLGYLTDSDTRKMQDLVDGKSISFILNDSMNYDSLSEHDPNDFWSLLLHTGYLTLDCDYDFTYN